MANLISRKSAQLDMEVEKGTTFRHKLTWKSGLEGSETPVDLTGATARMQLRPTITSASILHEMTTENGGIELGGALGTVDLLIIDIDSTAFNWKKAAYSLEVVMANTDIVTLIRGTVVAYDETTRV